MTNLIFDFDGTLHDTIRIYAPAFRKAYQYLVIKGCSSSREWRDEEISVWLGFNSKDMWDMFMPELSEAEKENCSHIIGTEMLSELKSGRARLYDGISDVLRQLKSDGYRLIFLSNCKISYMHESIRQFSLDQFFTAFYCTEQYVFAPKHAIFRDIARKHEGNFIVIGDRYVDIEIVEMYSFPSIGCGYGYGNGEELKNATIIVNSPYDIVKAVRHLNLI